MKYLLPSLALFLACIYLVIERSMKGAVCVAIFLWHFSFDKKYYSFLGGVILISPARPFFFKTVKEYFAQLKMELSRIVT